MGSFQIERIRTSAERNRFYRHMLNDLETFELMLLENAIENRNDRIGAEQELCIVDSNGQPLNLAKEILSGVNDTHFTHELALYNLEINLDPVVLAPDGIQQMEAQLARLMRTGSEVAADNNAFLFLTGILPTIQARHLRFDNMTPIERYRTINDILLEMRGSDFEIYLQGVDDFNVTLSSDLFEACNTSFQCHLQVDPIQFVQQYNWAQMISGPVLACATNAPLLFGRELWAETRIALFKQSLDTRDFHDFTRIHMPRVHFGSDWVRRSPAEIWQNGVTRFPALMHTSALTDSKELFNQGTMPSLRALQLHNGTTYAWNRLCYGVKDNVAHIRIECRYIPAGPTMIDQMANLAFWVGLMRSQPPDGELFWQDIDFRIAKDNFIRAARTGIHSVFSWFGKRISAQKLILDKLLPMSYKGLEDAGVPNSIAAKYLGIIQARVDKASTGSEWAIKNVRKLRKEFQPTAINSMLVREGLQNQTLNLPVHEWSDISDGGAKG